MGIAPLLAGVVGGGVAASSMKAPSTTVNNNTTQHNPYQDDWIHDRFGEGQSQIDELTKFMNERRAALAQPQMLSISGQNIRQDQLGEYIANQIGRQTGDLNRQLAEYQSGVNKSFGQLGQQRDLLKSTYDARLADVTAAAGIRDQRLADITSAAGANQSAIKAQQEALARQGERARAAQEQNAMVAGVKANIKPKNRYRYGTAGSFNRAGLRINSLNI